MKTMYAITHVDKDGLRTLTFANQGRNHYETEKAARKHLNAIHANNDVHAIWGDAADTLEVRPVECYDHGDAVGIYFDPWGKADHEAAEREHRACAPSCLVCGGES